MEKKNKRNPRMMLDAIEAVIKDKYISLDQSQMVEKITNGRKGTMACKICCKGEEILLCSFDEKGYNYRHFPYFKQKEGMVCMCDYILFAEDENQLFVFSIDLKDTANGPKQQTLRTKIFAEFIINRIKTVLGDNHFSKSVQYRQIGIKTTQEKMTTKGYEQTYDADGYLLLPDYHKFYTKWLMDMSY